jgi:hypothetical protein
MKIKFNWTFVLGAILACSLFVNVFQGKDKVELGDQLNEANARAATFEAAFDQQTLAYRALAFQVTTDTELKAKLRRTNAELASEIEEAGATILALQEINTEFSQRLSASGTTDVVEGESGALTFDLFSREEWGEASFLQVTGPVTATPDTASWELEVSGAFSLTTVVDRRGDADLAVSVFFDNDNFRATSVNVTNNVFDPLIVPDRGFFGDLWQGIKGELFSLDAWRHRGEGVILTCLTLGC